jgi:hypothetical protein
VADASISLQPLRQDAAQQLARSQLHKCSQQLHSWRGIRIDYTNAIVDWMLQRSQRESATAADSDSCNDGDAVDHDGDAIVQSASVLEGQILDHILAGPADQCMNNIVVDVRDGVPILQPR